MVISSGRSPTIRRNCWFHLHSQTACTHCLLLVVRCSMLPRKRATAIHSGPGATDTMQPEETGIRAWSDVANTLSRHTVVLATHMQSHENRESYCVENAFSFEPHSKCSLLFLITRIKIEKICSQHKKERYAWTLWPLPGATGGHAVRNLLQ
jgi:hypothetical protein